MIYRKGTLLVPSGPRVKPDQMHRHIVCNDTCERGLNLLIPVTSFWDGCDTTCELDVGDHEFIKHLSFVFYAKSQLFRAEQLSRGLDRKFVVHQPDLAEEIFERVASGICDSPDTPRKIKTYFGC